MYLASQAVILIIEVALYAFPNTGIFLASYAVIACYAILLWLTVNYVIYCVFLFLSIFLAAYVPFFF